MRLQEENLNTVTGSGGGQVEAGWRSVRVTLQDGPAHLVCRGRRVNVQLSADLFAGFVLHASYVCQQGGASHSDHTDQISS